jgi:hypothetical protein
MMQMRSGAPNRPASARIALLLDRQVKRKTETLFPANLMVLQHRYGPKQ